MLIIKRSGKTEEFSIDKIRAALAACSDEADQPFNESDLKRLTADLEQIISGKESLTTGQIVVIVAGILYTQGYFGALEHYLSYNRKRMK